MQRQRPITLEELKRLGWEPDCEAFLLEWAAGQLKDEQERIKAAEAILEGRADTLAPSQIRAGGERIEEWEMDEDEAQSDAAD